MPGNPCGACRAVAVGHEPPRVLLPERAPDASASQCATDNDVLGPPRDPFRVARGDRPDVVRDASSPVELRCDASFAGRHVSPSIVLSSSSANSRTERPTRRSTYRAQPPNTRRVTATWSLLPGRRIHLPGEMQRRPSNSCRARQWGAPGPSAPPSANPGNGAARTFVSRNCGRAYNYASRAPTSSVKARRSGCGYVGVCSPPRALLALYQCRSRGKSTRHQA